MTGTVGSSPAPACTSSRASRTAGSSRSRRATARRRSSRAGWPASWSRTWPHGPGHARLSHQVTPRATVAAMVGGRRLPGLHHGVRRPRPVPGARVAGRVRRPPLPSNRLADGSLCTLFTSPEIPGGAIGSTTAFGERARAALVEGVDAGWRCATGRLRSCGRPRFNSVSDRPVGRGRRGACVTARPGGGPRRRGALPFALMGFVTDHANGVGAVPTPHETLARLFRESAGILQRALLASLPRLAASPESRPGSCSRSRPRPAPCPPPPRPS